MVYSQHQDKVGRYQDALDLIDKGIRHTPTLIELYLVKAKIYKHCFSLREAYKWTNKARKLDLADRYLNNKSIKYALYEDLTEEADILIRLFLRDPTDGNAYDLQTLWFEVALAESFIRQ